MGLKYFRFKLKALRLRRFRIGDGIGRSKKRELEKNKKKKKPSWMVPISHGYHVVEDHSFMRDSQELDSDFVVVQREQIEEDLELWLFGVFDARISDGVTKYLQSHLLDKKPNEMDIRRLSKETMRKAYLGARARTREAQRSDESWRGGSAASVMVMNGEKLVMANMGGYRIVVCRDGVAHHINGKHHQTPRRLWTRRLFSVRILACEAGNAEGQQQPECSEIVVRAGKVNSETEFIIIASNGVWEVMSSQEAVNLIWHIEDPQEAAKCLAREALSRMSKGNISCVVIRFD